MNKSIYWIKKYLEENNIKEFEKEDLLSYYMEKTKKSIHGARYFLRELLILKVLTENENTKKLNADKKRIEVLSK